MDNLRKPKTKITCRHCHVAKDLNEYSLLPPVGRYPDGYRDRVCKACRDLGRHPVLSARVPRKIIKKVEQYAKQHEITKSRAVALLIDAAVKD